MFMIPSPLQNSTSGINANGFDDALFLRGDNNNSLAFCKIPFYGLRKFRSEKERMMTALEEEKKIGVYVYLVLEGPVMQTGK